MDEMLSSYTDVHILNVGRGSCTIVESPSGRATMIDINDGGKLRPEEYEAIRQRASFMSLAEALIAKEEQMLDDPIDWFRTHIGTSLFRFILSHPDKDHMAGVRHLLSGSSGIDITNLWDYNHTRTRTEADYPNNAAGWLDWRWYMGFHKQLEWNVTWPNRMQPLRRASNHYWADDSIEILSPTTSLITDCNACDKYNDASYVIRVAHGPTSRLLAPADVESKAWNDMIAAGLNLRANVLIASHHGRNSGYHDKALDLIEPDVVIISSDELPAKDDASDKYKKRAHVFSTRDHGTLTVRMHDGGDVEIFDRSGSRLLVLHDAVASSA
jgi:competence protein ComEC